MRTLRRLFLAALLLAVASLSALWTLWRAEPKANTAQQHFDIILVLGTPSNLDGSPSPEQRERVLEGVRDWRNGVAPRIVMSGGAAHNSWMEAQSMAQFAVRQGVPADDVLEESRAQNTIQNVYYTVAIMQAHGWHSADVVSSWSHLPRAARILSHFPIAWRTDAAPWSREFTFYDRALRDWYEAAECLYLRVHGFTPSPFISR
jgi:uncharacterized SAM-binding protein YcdF (DUF218 family)